MPSNDVFDVVFDYDTDTSVFGNVFTLVDLVLKTTLEEALGVFCSTPVDVFSNSIVDTNR
jgi:hypothetical protein